MIDMIVSTLLNHICFIQVRATLHPQTKLEGEMENECIRAKKRISMALNSQKGGGRVDAAAGCTERENVNKVAKRPHQRERTWETTVVGLRRSMVCMIVCLREKETLVVRENDGLKRPRRERLRERERRWFDGL